MGVKKLRTLGIAAALAGSISFSQPAHSMVQTVSMNLLTANYAMSMNFGFVSGMGVASMVYDPAVINPMTHMVSLQVHSDYFNAVNSLGHIIQEADDPYNKHAVWTALRKEAEDNGYREAVRSLDYNYQNDYLVYEGDTLWEIARAYLGDPLRWEEIAAANDVYDPRLLPIGKGLVIRQQYHSTEQPINERTVSRTNSLPTEKAVPQRSSDTIFGSPAHHLRPESLQPVYRDDFMQIVHGSFDGSVHFVNYDHGVISSADSTESSGWFKSPQGGVVRLKAEEQLLINSPKLFEGALVDLYQFDQRRLAFVNRENGDIVKLFDALDGEEVTTIENDPVLFYGDHQPVPMKEYVKALSSSGRKIAKINTGVGTGCQMYVVPAEPSPKLLQALIRRK